VKISVPVSLLYKSNGNFSMILITLLDRNKCFYRLPVFRKVPEICLKMDDHVYSSTGQVCKYEWHEENRLVYSCQYYDQYCQKYSVNLKFKTSSADF